MPETPEQKARRNIDAKLFASGLIVQSREDLDLTAGRGIAVREFVMKSGFGFADYLLYLDRKAVGAVEAKAEGSLAGVEAQSAKYAAGLPDNLPAHRRPLPFLFESNGAVTFFTNGLDPMPTGLSRHSLTRSWREVPLSSCLSERNHSWTGSSTAHPSSSIGQSPPLSIAPLQMGVRLPKVRTGN